MAFPIFTIGHSNHAMIHFLALVKGVGLDAVVDIRSVPMSKHNPQFRQIALKDALEEAGVEYIYMGKALGGHPRAPEAAGMAPAAADLARLSGFQGPKTAATLSERAGL